MLQTMESDQLFHSFFQMEVKKAPAECNYGQIEKDALAIMFDIKKFHKILYGQHFILVTDHNPLVSIFRSKETFTVYTTNNWQCWVTLLLD